MRVIGGEFRSRPLKSVPGLDVRPTPDRLREALFNILSPRIEGVVFADLYAGTGAVGIEALSRGAQHAIFVEKHRSGVELLRRNLESLEIPPGGTYAPPRGKSFGGCAEVLAMDVMGALDALVDRGVLADLIFADPPYADTRAYDSVLEWIGDAELLGPGGRLILEHERRRILPAFAGQLERTRTLEQGDAVLSFYRRVQAA
jgi:16S rRNA (guanine(966)-N(2))-methyltransferase RsmD